MHMTLLTFKHDKVDEISKLHRRVLAEHVVVFVNVKDKGWDVDNTFLDRGVFCALRGRVS